MYHPLRSAESAWNARTPVYLHNGTKENIIFQLALSVVLVSGMIVYYEWRDRQERRLLDQKYNTSA